MALSDLLIPRRAKDDDRFTTARRDIEPDESEAHDTALHVRNERRRFDRLIDLHEVQFDASQQNKSLLLLIGAYLGVTQLDKVVAFIKFLVSL